MARSREVLGVRIPSPLGRADNDAALLGGSLLSLPTRQHESTILIGGAFVLFVKS